MANNLDIVEVTLAQASDSTHAVNTIGNAAGNRPHWDSTRTIRITDHQDNVVLEEDDADQMALFTSKAQGQPWTKDKNVLIHKVVEADADPVANPTPVDVSVLMPNYDYSTFE